MRLAISISSVEFESLCKQLQVFSIHLARFNSSSNNGAHSSKNGVLNYKLYMFINYHHGLY